MNGNRLHFVSMFQQERFPVNLKADVLSESLVYETVPGICKSLRQDLRQYCSNLSFFWICLHGSKSKRQLLGLPI